MLRRNTIWGATGLNGPPRIAAMTNFRTLAARLARAPKAPAQAKPQPSSAQDVTVAALVPAGLLRPSGW